MQKNTILLALGVSFGIFSAGCSLGENASPDDEENNEQATSEPQQNNNAENTEESSSQEESVAQPSEEIDFEENLKNAAEPYYEGMHEGAPIVVEGEITHEYSAHENLNPYEERVYRIHAPSEDKDTYLVTAPEDSYLKVGLTIALYGGFDGFAPNTEVPLVLGDIAEDSDIEVENEPEEDVQLETSD
ncbi:hypothetical protein SAMN05421781_0526 [Marinococcus luteus]|uniref:tRNA_anti-like n=1 Tax=Marinococcus luteus TaxID=1122204 RepID=A0A1H2QZA7_9BACI|nr:hypothetical protein [Marinococcus luteus]SDW12425.1 hypothetical protein SAMN05421781_0526 [Marinococcus luteus]